MSSLRTSAGSGSGSASTPINSASMRNSSPTDVPPVPSRAVVDTTGAGDAFTAAVAVELAAGRSVDDAAHFASQVGSYVVARHEVIPALPRREDLRRADLGPGLRTG